MTRVNWNWTKLSQGPRVNWNWPKLSQSPISFVSEWCRKGILFCFVSKMSQTEEIIFFSFLSLILVSLVSSSDNLELLQASFYHEVSYLEREQSGRRRTQGLIRLVISLTHPINQCWVCCTSEIVQMRHIKSSLQSRPFWCCISFYLLPRTSWLMSPHCFLRQAKSS